MMYWGNHMGTGGWIFSILATVVFVALIVALIVWMVSPNSRSDGSSEVTVESPRDILDRRLASGEITVEQYSRLREALGDASETRPQDPAGMPG
jgi:putative membrane protein